MSAVSLPREEIIRMARDAGEAEGMELVFHPVIERLANAAYAAGAAAEREACAKVCDARYDEYFVADMDDKAFASLFCAQAIRAGGDK